MSHEERVRVANAAVLAGRASLRREWYPVMHLAPFSGWAGAVCAFVRYGALYHVFYEHNPHSASASANATSTSGGSGGGAAVHWGHATSEDLVHWRHHPIALAPGDDCDRDGCLAGSAVTHDDKLCVFYTGHHCMRDGSDVQGEVYQVQCLAVSEDGFSFDKRGIVVKPPAHFVHFAHPHVWHEDARWWMLCSALDDKGYAHLLLYSTDDVEDWDDSVYTVLYKSDDKNVVALAHADFVAYGGSRLRVLSVTRRVVASSSSSATGDGELAGYIVGTWSPGMSFVPLTRFAAHDAGGSGAYAAAQTCLAHDGRCIALALLGAASPSSARSLTRGHGWHGMLSVPRVWSLDEQTHRLRVTPARELEGCRQRHYSLDAQVLRADTRVLLLASYSDACEVKITWATTAAASKYGVWLGTGCEVAVEPAAQCVTLTRHYIEHVVSSRRSCPLPDDAGASLTLHLFVDRSSVEVFVHDGAAVLSARIYPGSSSSSATTERSVSVFAIGASAHILRADAWTLAPTILQ